MIAPYSVQVGQSLLLGLIAETEQYFRCALSGLVEFCPLAVERVGSEDVKVVSVINHGPESVGRGLMDNVSFASMKNVAEQTQRVAGMSIQRGSPLSKCLTYYDKLCHLRHAAVHSAGELGINNRISLGLPNARHVVIVDYGGFTSATGACHNLVRAYNRQLYHNVVTQWIGAGVLTGVWANDKLRFTPLYRLFYSESDAVGARRPFDAYKSLSATLTKVATQTTDGSRV